jgi:hypothetical protein
MTFLCKCEEKEKSFSHLCCYLVFCQLATKLFKNLMASVAEPFFSTVPVPTFDNLRFRFRLSIWTIKSTVFKKILGFLQLLYNEKLISSIKKNFLIVVPLYYGSRDRN